MNVFIFKLFGKPVGIWFTIVALAYAFYFEMGLVAHSNFASTAVTYSMIITAFIAIMRRRLIARVLSGMALAFLLRDAVTHPNFLGIILAPLGFFALLPNRRWFDEYMGEIR